MTKWYFFLHLFHRAPQRPFPLATPSLSSVSTENSPAAPPGSRAGVLSPQLASGSLQMLFKNTDACSTPFGMGWSAERPRPCCDHVSWGHEAKAPRVLASWAPGFRLAPTVRSAASPGQRFRRPPASDPFYSLLGRRQTVFSLSSQSLSPKDCAGASSSFAFCLPQEIRLFFQVATFPLISHHQPHQLKWQWVKTQVSSDMK